MLEDFEYGGECCICDKLLDNNDAGYCSECGKPFCWDLHGGWGSAGHICDHCRIEKEAEVAEVMECTSCDITDYGEFDGCVTLLSAKTPIAIKIHSCDECKRIIRKGESYTREKTIFEGVFIEYITCSDCKSIRDTFFPTFSFILLRSDFIDCVVDCQGQLSETKISKLTPAAREWVCDQIEKYWSYSMNTAGIH